MKILLINQAFYPDVVSTSQHLTDLAVELCKRGHAVSVIAGNHGYDDPSLIYPRSEEYKGVQIHRIYYPSYGKKSKLSRAVDILIFQFNLLIKLMLFPRQQVVVGLTSPPLVAVFGSLFCLLKGGHFVYWVMDMNPDEAIAAGWLSRDSFTGRLLRRIARNSYRNSKTVVALDHFMKEKIKSEYGIQESKVAVMPPWAHDEHLHPVDSSENSFLETHGLGGKFIVMYSGNHSPCHPLDTVLQAALRYKDDGNVIFCFIGGGSLVPKIRAFKESQRLNNIIQLPYQPLNKLSESLSAANLHVVVMGSSFVGIVHPCKIYGILSVGRPFVFIGPKKSHIGEMVQEMGLGYHVEHHDVDGMVAVIEAVRKLGRSDRDDILQKSLSLKNSKYSSNLLCGKIANLVEMQIDRPPLLKNPEN